MLLVATRNGVEVRYVDGTSERRLEKGETVESDLLSPRETNMQVGFGYLAEAKADGPKAPAAAARKKEAGQAPTPGADASTTEAPKKRSGKAAEKTK